MRMLAIAGTRPEAIKLAPVLHALAAEPLVRPLLCITGQHRALIEGPLAFFGLTPDHDLDLMEPGQPLGRLLARAIGRIDAMLARARPDRVIVQGDTTTAFAAATAAFHRGIAVAHVEAGLRTYAARAPFPEEMNRRAIALMADLHFAPTALARAQLAAERLNGRVFVTGNSGIDALFAIRDRLAADAALRADAAAALPATNGRRLVLVTAHRRESLGAPFLAICEAVAALARRDDVEIVWPLHPNPALKTPAEEALRRLPNVHLVAPLDLAAFVHAMTRADLILTDSGGVQEEAATLGRPALVLREATERPEGVAAGLATLVGTDPARIVAEAAARLDSPHASGPCDIYGDGRAARRIADGLVGREVAEFVPGRQPREAIRSAG
jgi:UDP-N-acetylglucosamine 2-epimerase (non-hydrolysing)